MFLTTSSIQFNILYLTPSQELTLMNNLFNHNNNNNNNDNSNNNNNDDNNCLNNIIRL